MIPGLLLPTLIGPTLVASADYERRKNTKTRFAKTLSLLFILSTSLQSQDFRIPWSTFSMGFETITEPNTRVRAIVGQLFIVSAQEGNTHIHSGFLVNILNRASLTPAFAASEIPLEFYLSQNYPNPFNPATTIHLEVPIAGFVTLKVYDLLGREVGVLLAGELDAGQYQVRWDAIGLPSGAYFYRLVARPFVETKKMILMR